MKIDQGIKRYIFIYKCSSCGFLIAESLMILLKLINQFDKIVLSTQQGQVMIKHAYP